MDRQVRLEMCIRDRCMEVIHHPNAHFIKGIEPLAKYMMPLAEKRIAMEQYEEDVYKRQGQRRVSIVNNKHSFKVCVSFHQPGFNGIAQTVLCGLVDLSLIHI